VKYTSDIGKIKIISQSSIAAGVRRIEALRDKQLENYLRNKEEIFSKTLKKNEEAIKELSEQIIKFGGKPKTDQVDQKTLIKNLTDQLEKYSVKSILNDKSKNLIKDEKINGVKLRLQKVDGLASKELRKLVDNGKKDLGEGIVIVFTSKDEKISIGVGITDNLIEKYNAVKFVKIGSEIIGGKGGGGRKDFAQAGGLDSSKIEEAFEKLKSLV
jgi:alanyl-tRNA synthetase